MKRDGWIIGIALIIAVAGFTGASMMTRPINTMREDLQLTFHPDVMRNAPPEIAIAQAGLGVFRGLAIDAAWMYANYLKEEGHFHQAMQLSQWITQLQPRFPQVWQFHAWNMAYNISVATHTAEERWMWVQRGIDLLRDKAIPMNPRSLLLYRELGWIFMHKVGQLTDEAHYYYKVQLAREWHELLGEPPIAGQDAYIEWFAPIAEAYERYMNADQAQADEAVGRFIEANPTFAERWADLVAIGYEADASLLRALGRLEMIRQADETQLKMYQFDIESMLGDQERQLRIWREDIESGLYEDFLAMLRAKVLVQAYHMDPQYMLGLMERFGPVDFRHPMSHGLYWSALGVERAMENIAGPSYHDQLNTDRQVIHAVQALTHQGKLVFDPITGYYSELANLAFVDAYDTALLDSIRRLDENEDEQDAQPVRDAESLEDVETPRTLAAGHENFLLWAMGQAWMAGDEALAGELFRRARDRYADEDHRAHRYVGAPMDIIRREIRNTIDTRNTAAATIAGYVMRAIHQGLANNEAEIAARSINEARELHRWYNEKRGWGSQINVKAGRLTLPPFNDMLVDIFINFMRDPSIHPLRKATVWKNLGKVNLKLQQTLYDTLRPTFERIAEASRMNMEQAFAEPVGMAEYREENPGRTRQITEESNAPQQ